MTHKFIFHKSSSLSGQSIYLMEISGIAFARIYFFNNDSSSAYLDSLSVNPDHRNKGIATKLQILTEDIAKLRNNTKTYLLVEQNSWMHHWYKRRGYTDVKPNKTEKNYIWMVKNLIPFHNENL
jgi:GNAT superfamily N-acetyltransferase